MTAPIDPLARLIFDEAEFDRKILAELLDGRVRLDVRRGVFAFQHGTRARMTKRQLVLVALLSQKALNLLVAQFPDALRPQEIEALTGVSGNTLRPILKVLADRGITRRGEDPATHQVAPYGLEAAAILLSEAEEAV